MLELLKVDKNRPKMDSKCSQIGSSIVTKTWKHYGKNNGELVQTRQKTAKMELMNQAKNALKQEF